MSLKLGNNTINNVKLGSTQVHKVYLGSNLIWSNSPYSTELTAIIARANTEGFTLPSGSTLTHVETLISAYKSAGIWNKQDRLYNFAYNDISLTNFARIDWKNPSTSPLLTLNGGLSYVSAGYQGNAVDGYIDTGFAPATHGVNYTQNNAGRSALVYSAGTGGSVPIDGNSANNNVMFIASTSSHKINSTLALSGGNVNLSSAGLKSIERDDSTNIRVIQRTTSSSRTATSDVLPTQNQYLFRNATNYSNNLLSMYCIGASLTLTEVTAIRNDYNTYLTAIGLTAIPFP